MNPEELKKELEELVFYQVATDILEYPLSKPGFAPYVVNAFMKDVPKEEIIQDVFAQLEKEIEHNKLFSEAMKHNDSVENIKPTFKARIKKWFRIFKNS